MIYHSSFPSPIFIAGILSSLIINAFAAFLTTLPIVHHLYQFVRFKFVDPFLPFKFIVATDRLANPNVDISIRGHNTRIPPSANEGCKVYFNLAPLGQYLLPPAIWHYNYCEFWHFQCILMSGMMAPAFIKERSHYVSNAVTQDKSY